MSAFGRYVPSCRFNCDQVPFNLDGNPDRAYMPPGAEQAGLPAPPSADKRTGTLQLCIHPDRDRPQMNEAQHVLPW